MSLPDTVGVLPRGSENNIFNIGRMLSLENDKIDPIRDELKCEWVAPLNLYYIYL